MYTRDKIDKFFELRARGWSLGHIATELDISKRTLVDWNGEYAKEIESFRTLEWELLKEKFIASREEELNNLHRFQKDIADELGNRGLKYIDTEKLFRLSVELREEIERMLHAKDPVEGSTNPSLNGHPRSVTPATTGDACPHQRQRRQQRLVGDQHSRPAIAQHKGVLVWL